jgi:[lysine-biosynthesis-protein LysW]--L-2-aminoadipate ligase
VLEEVRTIAAEPGLAVSPVVEGPRRVVLLGGATNETNPQLVAAWRQLGIDCELVEPHDARELVGRDDAVLARLDVAPTLDGVEPGLLHLLWFERAGVRVLNRARSLLTAHDKLRSARRLQAARIPHPRTIHLSAGGSLPLRAPVVLKPRFGSWGRDVRLCENALDVSRCMEEFAGRPWFRRHGVLLQEVIPSSGHDLRVLVAAGRVVGAVERVAAPGEWRTNVSVGGSTRPANPPPGARSLAVAAAAAIGADLVGVDLLPLPDGRYVVIELNGAIDFDQRYSLDDDVYAAAANALGLAAEVARIA